MRVRSQLDSSYSSFALTCTLPTVRRSTPSRQRSAAPAASARLRRGPAKLSAHLVWASDCVSRSPCATSRPLKRCPRANPHPLLGAAPSVLSLERLRLSSHSARHARTAAAQRAWRLVPRPHGLLAAHRRHRASICRGCALTMVRSVVSSVRSARAPQCPTSSAPCVAPHRAQLTSPSAATSTPSSRRPARASPASSSSASCRSARCVASAARMR